MHQSQPEKGRKGDATIELVESKMEGNTDINPENAKLNMKSIHKCNVCNLMFVEKAELSSHMMTHTNSEFITFSRNNPGEKPFTLRNIATTNEVTKASMKPHKCSLCQDVFSAMDDLVHDVESKAYTQSGNISSEKEEHPRKCTVCGQIFALKRYLRYHKTGHANSASHACTTCKKKFTEKAELTEHIKKHADGHFLEQANECVSSGKLFLGNRGLDHVCPQKTIEELPNQSEIAASSWTLPFECYVCKLMFQHETELQEHLLTHGIVKQEIPEDEDSDEDVQENEAENENERNTCKEEPADNEKVTHTEENLYTCASCGEGFDEEDDFIRHMCSDTGADKDTAMKHHLLHAGLKTFICAVCDKVFPRKQLLVIHERKHTGETPFKCSTCGKGFAAKNSLTKHEMIHTGEKPCVCKVCGKAFGRSGTLTVHMRLHTGEKPYKCSMCDEGFTRRQLLIIHERKHTGEKPYKCETCGKGFITRNTLNKHEMIHTGERPCVCTVCGKSFARKSTLNIHMRTHTGDTPYKCTVCDEGFVNSVGLKYHMTTTHSAEKTSQSTDK